MSILVYIFVHRAVIPSVFGSWGLFEYKKTTEISVVNCAKRRPTLTGGSPQLPSALESLTSVFGMGTGVTSLPSSLHYVR